MPWKPATTTTLPVRRGRRGCFAPRWRGCAPWCSALSVRIGTCAAGVAARLDADAPAARGHSSADRDLLAGGGDDVELARVGIGCSSLARPSRRLVSPDIAEGTTTSWWPSRSRSARRAGRLRGSARDCPSEVPPYFWTIRDTGRACRQKRLFYLAAPPYPHEEPPPTPECRADHPRLRGGGKRARVGRSSGAQVEREAGAEFAAKAQLAANVVERRIQRYVDLLYGLDALANHDADAHPPRFPRLRRRRSTSASACRACRRCEFVRRVPEDGARGLRRPRARRPLASTSTAIPASTCAQPARARRVLGDRLRRAA